MSQKMVDAVKEMVQAPSCCAELKTAGKEWLEAVGTQEQGEKAVALLAEAKADICTIDQVYDLFVSDTGKKMFGEKQAAVMAEHAKEVKSAGGQYCDCGACVGAKFVMDHEKELTD